MNRPELADFDPATGHRHDCYRHQTGMVCDCAGHLYVVAQDTAVDPFCRAWKYGKNWGSRCDRRDGHKGGHSTDAPRRGGIWREPDGWAAP